MAIAMIAALGNDLSIGRRGGMPWHLPDDLRRFKRLTLGKPVLMGRKTALAIGRLLPGRDNLLLSRNGDALFAGQQVVRSLEEARLRAGNADLLVIGGGEVYHLALPLACSLHLTWVDTTVADADSWFPALDREAWIERSREHHHADKHHAHPFDWVDYVRR